MIIDYATDMQLIVSMQLINKPSVSALFMLNANVFKIKNQLVNTYAGQYIGASLVYICICVYVTLDHKTIFLSVNFSKLRLIHYSKAK